MKKTSDKPKLRDILQNTRPGRLKTIKVIKNQRKSEEPSQSRGA